MADRDNVVVVGGGDTTGAQTRRIISQVTCICLRAEREGLMMASKGTVNAFYSNENSYLGGHILGAVAEANSETDYQSDDC